MNYNREIREIREIGWEKQHNPRQSSGKLAKKSNLYVRITLLRLRNRYLEAFEALQHTASAH